MSQYQAHERWQCLISLLPRENQYLRDYFYSICDLNCYPRDWVANKLKIKHLTERAWDFRSKSYSNTLNSILGMLAAKCSESHCFKEPVLWDRKVELGEYPVIRSRVHKHPRVCVTCFKESAYIRKDWMFTPLTVCERHKEVLQDKCNCGRLFNWSHRNYHCPCGKSWKELPQGKKVPSLITLDMLLTSEKLSVERLESLANSLARPLDILSASVPFNTLPNDELHELLYFSAAFTFDASLRKRFLGFLKRRIDEQQAPAKNKRIWKDLILEGIKWWKSLPADQQFSDHGFSQLERLTFLDFGVNRYCVIGNAQKLYENIRVGKALMCEPIVKNSALAFGLVDRHYLGNLLKVGKIDVYRMTEVGAIKPIEAKSKNGVTYFDLLQLQVFIDPVKASLIYSAIDLRVLFYSRHLKHFNATMATVITLVKEGELDLYDATEMSEFGTCKLDYKRFVETMEQKILSDDDDVSCAVAAEIFGVKVEVIYALEALGFLYTNHWQKPFNRENIDIKRTSFCAFYEEYISFQQLKTFTGHTAARVLKEMRALSVCPAIDAKGERFWIRKDLSDYLNGALADYRSKRLGQAAKQKYNSGDNRTLW